MLILRANEPCHLCTFLFPDEDNLQGWFFAEDDGNQIKKQKHPLLLRQMPVVMSKLQEFKVWLLNLALVHGWLAQLVYGDYIAKVRGSATVQAVFYYSEGEDSWNSQ